MDKRSADSLIAELRALFVRCPWALRVNWPALREHLLKDDPEALEYAANAMDEDRCREIERERRRESRQERRQRAYEEQGIDLDEIAYLGPERIDELARGHLVWAYHGTSSRFASDIERNGLVPGVNRIDAKQNGIYLTARHGSWSDSGGTAVWYAQRAAGQFGGEPVVIRVLVPYDALVWDTDDKDIESGRYQWLIGSVPPASICEIDGDRVRGRCES